MLNISKQCIIIGTGPAALMAASTLCKLGITPDVYEKRAAAGWKLLVAGSSGLNISYHCTEEELLQYYDSSELKKSFNFFSRESWIEFLHSLGEETFLGTSKRYFVKNKTASSLLNSWQKKLQEQNVSFYFEHELKNFTVLENQEIEVEFENGNKVQTKTLLLALGGASWLNEKPKWTSIFNNIHFTDFTPANAGYHLQAPEEFFLHAEGKPIKGLTLKTKLGEKQGELMITKYGLEGTPIYTMGCIGEATLDLKPDLSEEKLIARLKNAPGNLENRLLKAAKLSDGALLLVKYLAPKEAWENNVSLAKFIKNFPITLTVQRPLSEAISSQGGINWSELTDSLELRKFPGVFCAGEMINWHAPTGGFLIQACVSTGALAADGIAKKLNPSAQK